jgi:hypothetical protein
MSYSVLFSDNGRSMERQGIAVSGNSTEAEE